MPSLQEWLDALTVEKNIRVDASQRLADDIKNLPPSRSFLGQAKNAQSPQIVPSQRIKVTAADLLLVLGRITTPRIQNLVYLSGLWAYIRYIWAFDPDPTMPDMCLSQDALRIDSHQKNCHVR
jgi:hypothetical protein